MRKHLTPIAPLAAPSRIAVSWFCLVLLAGFALAHSPHLGSKTDWTAPDGKRYSVAMLWGDGIIGADPGSPVVLDETGQVVALGPVVKDGFVHCRAPSDCVVILDRNYFEKDPRPPAAVVPDPSTFQPGRSPDFYPEEEKVFYGFKPASLILADQWVAWTVLYRRAPLFAVLWTLLWMWLGLKSGGILAAARRVGQHFPLLLPLRVVGFAVAWTGYAVAAALAPLILLQLSLCLDGSLLNLPPVLAAFCVGVAVGLWRALFRSGAASPGTRECPSAGAATN
jgi:hypothetical protein